MPTTSESSKHAPPTPSTSTSDDQTDLDAINSSIDRMRTFTPTDPYVLTIPQDVEPRYRHAYQTQATQWLQHAPFQWREGEGTQYQSFIYHEHGRDMYVLHPSRFSEEAEVGGAAKVKAKASTGATTPSGGPKKKISLDAYKKKQTPGGTPAQEQAGGATKAGAPVKQAAVKGPVERVKAETEEVLAAVVEEELEPERQGLKRKREAVEDEVEPPLVTAETESKRLKRKREDAERHDEKLSDAPPASSLGPVAKRARRSPSPAPRATVKRAEDRAGTPPPTSFEDTGLPPRLSPLQVPTAEETLPARLSPTIPANMLATLKAREHLHSSSSDSSVPSSAIKNGKLTPGTTADRSAGKHKSPIPRNAFRANSSSPAVRARTPDLSQDDVITAGKAPKATTQDVHSLVVKLKYRKQRRDDIRRILNMRPRSNVSLTTPAVYEPEAEKPSIRRRDPNAKGVAQKVGPAVKKRVVEKAPVAEKRLPPTKRADGFTVGEEGEEGVRSGKLDEAPSGRVQPTANLTATGQETEVGGKEPGVREPATKEPATKSLLTNRKKAPAALDTKKDPSTPMQPDLLSPAVISSTHKSQQVTPTMRKDHLSIASVAMQRELSGGGGGDSNVNTPSAKSSNTPMANGTTHTSQPNGVVKPPSSQPDQASQPSSKTPRQQAWETEQKRLETLGRELKHAATAHLKSLAITHSSPTGPSNEQKLAAVKSVESLLAYILAFTCADEAALAADPPMNPSIKTWRSLLGFFNFVKRNCKDFPLLLGLTCQLGVVFNARIIDITLHYPSERPAGRDITMETYASLSKNAADAETNLDVDALQDHFPRSWKLRAKGPLLGAQDKLVGPKDFAGEYKLPIGVQTPPLRAARAGYAMLEEWIGRELGGGYEMRLKL